MNHTNQANTLARIVALMLATALVIGAAPATASILSTAHGTSSQKTFLSQLDTDPNTLAAADKVTVPAPTEDAVGYTEIPAKAQAVVPRPVVSRHSPATNSGGSAATPVSATKPAASSTDTLSQARAILNRYIATYPILRGSTVEIGDTRGYPQAIVYYQSGRIVINPNHTVSLERIIDHEIWHIIDWRHNGRIDWGENVPPSNAADFRG